MSLNQSLSKTDNYLDRYRDDIYNTLDYAAPSASRGLIYAHYMSDMLTKGDKVLCIGCGNGYEVIEFIQNGMDAYGTETRKVDVPILKNRIIDAICPGLPFKKDKFDYVHCCEVLEHIPEEITLPFIQEILQVGKKAFFSTSTTDDPPWHSHINFHPPGWWLKRLEELDCRVINFQYNPTMYLRYENKALSAYLDKNRVIFYVSR